MKKSKTYFTAVFLLLSSVIYAEQDTMIVFDSSGSMWGQLEGKTKIEIARDAITTITSGFNEDQSVGLMAYGHRNKGDCSDIELLVEPGKNTAEKIKAHVNKLSPKGKTPLNQAVKLAAEKMKYTEKKAEVVLITDGVETCDIDTCANAIELEKQGIDFTAHVIGFGLNADQGKQVSCLADLTGGRYVLANDAASLNNALEQVMFEDEISEPEVKLPEASIIVPTEEIVIGAGFTVKWNGPNGELDYIDLVKTGYTKTYGELTYAWTKTENPSQLKAPGKPGEYDIRYIWQGPNNKHIVASQVIKVVESDVSLVAPASIKIGETFNVEWTGPNREGDYVDLVKKGNDKTYGEINYFYTEKGPIGQIQAPASQGEYEIRYIMEAPGGRQILYKTSLSVKESIATLSFDPTAEIAEKITVYWTGPINKGSYIDIVKVNYNRTYGEISYFYLKDSPENGELSTPVEPGNYQIRFVMEAVGGRKVLTTSPVTITDVNASLNLPQTAKKGTHIDVIWDGPNRNGDYVDLMRLDNNRTYGEITYFYTNNNPNKGSLKMPDQPGEYKVRYVLQGKQRRVLTEQKIIIEE